MNATTLLLTFVTFGQTLMVDCWPLWVVLLGAYAGRQLVSAIGDLADRAMLIPIQLAVEEPIEADV